ncbi:60S ribosomal protein L30-like [Drosophila obscura]|uniref:60S ribosomal protein L30-like n=1 Tax=Drosophila obscura TaxID=7282 RepID=UPI000BA18597|nr:60S ribosomal protein L30-like [Drosophila obscura]
MDLDSYCPGNGPPTEALKGCLKDVMESGQYILGHDLILKAIDEGRVGMVVIAAKAQQPNMSQILLATITQSTAVKVYQGTAQELGEACGKEHVNYIAILNEAHIDAIHKLGVVH